MTSVTLESDAVKRMDAPLIAVGVLVIHARRQLIVSLRSVVVRVWRRMCVILMRRPRLMAVLLIMKSPAILVGARGVLV
jgi:hypothetical protein